MKKILMIVVMFLMIHLLVTEAVTFPSYLPGGKNYLDPLNMEIVGNNVSLINNIKIKTDTDYTLTIPGFDWVGENTYIQVYGTTSYLEEFAVDEPNCEYSYDTTICHFHTTGTEESIMIKIDSDMLGMYYSYYAYELFQLEEGLTSTTYEAYVAPMVDTTSPQFNGQGVYIKSYETYITLTDIIASHIVAYDEIDGDLSNHIVIESDQYTTHEQEVGEYHNILSVTDSSNNKATFELVVLVKDEIAPIIVMDDIIYLDVNDNDSITTVLSMFLEYSDGYDLSPTLTILNDTYTTHETQLGEYSITIEVEDGSLNTSQKTSTIFVMDYDPPVLVSSTNIYETIDSPRTLIDIINSLSITDNYDQDINITVENDTYSEHINTVGIYTVDLLLSDSSLNSDTVTLIIAIEDTISPIITGGDLIQFSYTNPLTIENIKNYVTVSDNYDSLDISDLYIVSDTYSNRQTDTGVFEVVLGIDDSSGNSGYKTIIVEVFDDVSPIIFVDEYIVVLEEGMSFTKNDALMLLLYNRELRNEEYDMEVLINEYIGNEEVPGKYLYKIKFTNIEGDVYIKDFVIQVDEIEQSNNIRYVISSLMIMTFVGFVFIKVKK